jgi:hypothetical protein
MEDSQESVQVAIPKEYVRIAVIVVIALVVLISVTVGAYSYAKKRTGTTILPGGSTYLGPSPASAPAPVSTTISVPIDAPAQIWKGQKHPYYFSYPTGLALGFFPGDPFDAVTVFWGNTNPSENIFIRVEDLNVMTDGKQYISKSKKEYANMWWKQYNWKGVSEIIEFTNSKGLKGFRAKYVDSAGQTPFDNVFFEVPGRRDLIVWVGGSKLEKQLFDRIVDTFGWGE